MKAPLHAVVALTVAVVIAGCTLRTVFHETGNPSDLRWWRTESRTRWYWYGLPTGQSPADVYFSTQKACEAFRRTHPDYTKPEEVCQPVYGVLTEVPVPRSPHVNDRDRELDACGGDEACQREQLCLRYRAAGRTDICPAQ